MCSWTLVKDYVRTTADDVRRAAETGVLPYTPSVRAAQLHVHAEELAREPGELARSMLKSMNINFSCKLHRFFVRVLTQCYSCKYAKGFYDYLTDARRYDFAFPHATNFGAVVLFLLYAHGREWTTAWVDLHRDWFQQINKRAHVASRQSPWEFGGSALDVTIYVFNARFNPNLIEKLYFAALFKPAPKKYTVAHLVELAANLVVAQGAQALLIYAHAKQPWEDPSIVYPKLLYRNQNEFAFQGKLTTSWGNQSPLRLLPLLVMDIVLTTGYDAAKLASVADALRPHLRTKEGLPATPLQVLEQCFLVDKAEIVGRLAHLLA